MAAEPGVMADVFGAMAAAMHVERLRTNMALAADEVFSGLVGAAAPPPALSRLERVITGLEPTSALRCVLPRRSGGRCVVCLRARARGCVRASAWEPTCALRCDASLLCAVHA